MHLDQIAAQLKAQADAIHALTVGISAEQARWQPAADSWSLLEVINHLDDEERLDFRVRLDLLLHKPHEPWPPTDPEGWVVSRAYNQRDLQTSLARFMEARADSINLAGDTGRSELGVICDIALGRHDSRWRYAGSLGNPRSAAHPPAGRTGTGLDCAAADTLPCGVCRRLVVERRVWGGNPARRRTQHPRRQEKQGAPRLSPNTPAPRPAHS